MILLGFITEQNILLYLNIWYCNYAVAISYSGWRW